MLSPILIVQLLKDQTTKKIDQEDDANANMSDEFSKIVLSLCNHLKTLENLYLLMKLWFDKKQYEFVDRIKHIAYLPQVYFMYNFWIIYLFIYLFIYFILL